MGKPRRQRRRRDRAQLHGLRDSGSLHGELPAIKGTYPALGPSTDDVLLPYQGTEGADPSMEEAAPGDDMDPADAMSHGHYGDQPPTDGQRMPQAAPGRPMSDYRTVPGNGIDPAGESPYCSSGDPLPPGGYRNGAHVFESDTGGGYRAGHGIQAMWQSAGIANPPQGRAAASAPGQGGSMASIKSITATADEVDMKLKAGGAILSGLQHMSAKGMPPGQDHTFNGPPSPRGSHGEQYEGGRAAPQVNVRQVDLRAQFLQGVRSLAHPVATSPAPHVTQPDVHVPTGSDIRTRLGMDDARGFTPMTVGMRSLSDMARHVRMAPGER
jgi:hypothetical protein